MKITIELLYEIGGWKEMKPAKALAAANAVIDLEVTDSQVSGLVSMCGKTYRAGLKWTEQRSAENLCRCPRSRREGIICEHSLAVGMAVINANSGNQQNRTNKGHESSEDHAGQQQSSENKWPQLTDSPTYNQHPLEWRFRLPPDLQRAVSLGKIQIGCEIREQRQGNWKLASNLSATDSYWVTVEAWPAIQWLQQLSPAEPPGILLLEPQQLADLLALGMDGVEFWAGNQLLQVTGAHEKIAARIGNSHDCPTLELSAPSSSYLQLGHTVLRVDGSTLQIIPQNLPEQAIEALVAGKALPLNTATGYAIASSAVEIFWLENPQDLPDFVTVEPQATFRLAGSLNNLRCYLKVKHPNGTDLALPATREPADLIGKTQNQKAQTPAQYEVVTTNSLTQLSDTLTACGFRAADDGAWLLRGEDAILRFIVRYLPVMKDLGTVEMQNSFNSQLESVNVVTASSSIRRNDQNWFSVKVDYFTGNSPVSPQEIDRLLRSGKAGRKLPNGKILAADLDMLNDFKDAIQEVDATQKSPGNYQLQNRDAPYIATILGHQLPPANTPQQGREQLPEVIERLPLTLTAYQLEGVHWLLDTLHNYQGALLADDMGLGKTIQTLVALDTISQTNLVVCPKALTAQWAQELKKVLPHRKCLILDRNNISHSTINKQDIFIYVVSYGTAREWDSIIQKKYFDCIIFDEIQLLRNPKTHNRKSVKKLFSRFCIGLSGTPLENRISDLWSVLDLVLPGYLGSATEFNDHYAGQSGGISAAAARRLTARLKPVMLRRLKSQVARQLPKKSVQCIECDMTPEQSAIYQEIAQKAAQLVVDETSYMSALTSLLRLRQAALDVRLLGLAAQMDDGQASGKQEVLHNLLEKCRNNDHKVLIYSSFRTVLQLLAAQLSTQSIPFSYLDGQTENRQLQVDRFQQDPAVSVFLLSLKAGGLGLNLTAAEVVIHLDPWWNPAAEEQANDRAYRIGQTKPVQIYKLISRNSVEEGILELQQKKLAMTQAILNAAQTATATLSPQELQKLLKSA